MVTTTRYEFTIIGKPFGKQRPRFARRGRFSKAFTPTETVNYEVQVRETFVRECNPTNLLQGPLRATITAHHPIPKSVSKKKRQLMLDGHIRPELMPDADNIAKVVLDALNQMAYADDKSIVELVVIKYYSEQPCVEVEIHQIGGLSTE